MPAAGQTIKPLVRLGRTADACWTWLGPTTPTGHGKKTYCGKDVLAHRWMYASLFGPIPPGYVVYLSCDSKDCVNPWHLRLGRQADANRQSVQTKLLPNEVHDIQLAKDNHGPHDAVLLAAKHGCSPQTIRDIWAGRSWRKKKAKHFGPGSRSRGRRKAPAPTPSIAS
jgi:hypothetical protein